SGGVGVIRVRKKDSGRYEIRYKSRKKWTDSSNQTYKYVKRKRKGRMIVQRYIRLGKVNGRPFDLRVMVQRKSTKSDKWKITGRLAKIAGKGYVITNVRRSGGKVTSASSAIRRSDIKGR